MGVRIKKHNRVNIYKNIIPSIVKDFTESGDVYKMEKKYKLTGNTIRKILKDVLDDYDSVKRENAYKRSLLKNKVGSIRSVNYNV